MAKNLLLDTDVLVEYLRGNGKAVSFVEKARSAMCISTVTVAELYAGVRDGSERRAMDGFIGAFEIIPVDEQIARQGGLFRREFAPSHGVGLGDALIAGTARVRNLDLVTLNKRHFPMLEAKSPY